MHRKASIEDTPLNLADIVVSDVDSATVTATLTLSHSCCWKPQYRHVGSGDLNLQCGDRRMVGQWCARQREHTASRINVTPTLNYNSNLTIATSVRRRRGAGDHRYKDRDRFRGHRRAGQPLFPVSKPPRKTRP